MPATSDRSVPLIALASRDSSAASKLTLPSTTFTRTRSSSACFSVPSGPLTTIWPAATWASTPLARLTGMRATRDIWEISASMPRPSGHVADDLAAHALHARLAVGHHALGGGDDRHAQPVHHLRQV